MMRALHSLLSSDPSSVDSPARDIWRLEREIYFMVYFRSILVYISFMSEYEDLAREIMHPTNPPRKQPRIIRFWVIEVRDYGQDVEITGIIMAINHKQARIKLARSCNPDKELSDEAVVRWLDSCDDVKFILQPVTELNMIE